MHAPSSSTHMFFRVYIQVHGSQTQDKHQPFGTAHSSNLLSDMIPPLRLHCSYCLSLRQVVIACQLYKRIMILLSPKAIFTQWGCASVVRGDRKEGRKEYKKIFSLPTLPLLGWLASETSCRRGKKISKKNSKRDVSYIDNIAIQNY